MGHISVETSDLPGQLSVEFNTMTDPRVVEAKFLLELLMRLLAGSAFRGWAQRADLYITCPHQDWTAIARYSIYQPSIVGGTMMDASAEISMVEKVGRALIIDQTGLVASGVVELTRDEIADAHAAISAMRVPPRAMLDAARLGLNHQSIRTVEAAALRTWQTMIDAALKDNLFKRATTDGHEP